MTAEEGFFGERVAAAYDEHAAEMFAPEVVTPVVDLLAELAGEGAALELAIGTGRIALPLAARGVPVSGIDDSEAMVARLQAKAGADEIEVVIGDMATTRVAGDFSLVYLVFNTIFNLVTQDAQVACFGMPRRTSCPAGGSSWRRPSPTCNGFRPARPSCRSVPIPAGSASTSTTS